MKKVIATLTVLASMSSFGGTVIDEFKDGNKYELIQAESDESCSILAPQIEVSRGRYQNSKSKPELLLQTGSRVHLRFVPDYTNAGKQVDRSYIEMYSETMERTYEISANTNTASIDISTVSKPDFTKRLFGEIDGALGGSYSRITSYDEVHQLDKTEDGFRHTVQDRTCVYKQIKE